MQTCSLTSVQTDSSQHYPWESPRSEAPVLQDKNKDIAVIHDTHDDDGVLLRAPAATATDDGDGDEAPSP